MNNTLNQQSTFWTEITERRDRNKKNALKNEKNILTYCFQELCTNDFLQKIDYSQSELLGLIKMKKDIIKEYTKERTLENETNIVYNVTEEYIINLLIKKFKKLRQNNTGGASTKDNHLITGRDNWRSGKQVLAYRAFLIFKGEYTHNSYIQDKTGGVFKILNFREDGRITVQGSTKSLNPENISKVKGYTQEPVDRTKTEIDEVLENGSLTLKELQANLKEKGVKSLNDFIKLRYIQSAKEFGFSTTKEALKYVTSLSANCSEIHNKLGKKPPNTKEIFLYLPQFIFNEKYSNQTLIQIDILNSFIELIQNETDINLLDGKSKDSEIFDNCRKNVPLIYLIYSVVKDSIFNDRIGYIGSGKNPDFFEFEIILNFIRKKCEKSNKK